MLLGRVRWRLWTGSRCWCWATRVSLPPLSPPPPKVPGSACAAPRSHPRPRRPEGAPAPRPVPPGSCPPPVAYSGGGVPAPPLVLGPSLLPSFPALPRPLGTDRWPLPAATGRRAAGPGPSGLVGASARRLFYRPLRGFPGDVLCLRLQVSANLRLFTSYAKTRCWGTRPGQWAARWMFE